MVVGVCEVFIAYVTCVMVVGVVRYDLYLSHTLWWFVVVKFDMHVSHAPLRLGVVKLFHTCHMRHGG